MAWTLLLLLPTNTPEDNELIAEKVEGLMMPWLSSFVLLPVKDTEAIPLITELILAVLSKTAVMLLAEEVTPVIEPLHVTEEAGMNAPHTAWALGNTPPTPHTAAKVAAI
ncbi:hypothetical protein [Comamonas sp. GB3 AK4-5]|uniref:hypothetical protein n=1 Tax=Comamonas sp. GB3 AK4-5 TaxID=3231487 RepID=UPI00351E19BC